MSKHPIAVLDHVATQIFGVTVAGIALQTHEGPLPGVNPPHVDLQVAFLLKALLALVAPVRLLTGVATHVDDHLGIVGKNLATLDAGLALAEGPVPCQLLTVDEWHAAFQALGHAAVQAHGRTVVRRQRAQGLQFGRTEEGIMAVHHQWALPISMDSQILPLPGHVGGARGVNTQTLRGGATLRAAVSKVTTVSCRDKNGNTDRERE